MDWYSGRQIEKKNSNRVSGREPERLQTGIDVNKGSSTFFTNSISLFHW